MYLLFSSSLLLLLLLSLSSLFAEPNMDFKHRVFFGVWCNVHQDLENLQNLYKQAIESSCKYFSGYNVNTLQE